MDNDSLSIMGAAAEAAGKESVNKLAEAVGGLFPFFGLRKKSVSVYISEIEASDLSPEAKMMAIANTKRRFKELNNQMTIASIAQDAAKEGTNFSETSAVDDDWLARFMDSARFVSDEQVQILWGYVLAREFEEPNTFSMQTIRIMSELSSQHATVFVNICNLLVGVLNANEEGKLIDLEELVFMGDPDDFYLKSLRINYGTISELQILGLVQYEPLTGFVSKTNKAECPIIHLNYGDNVTTIVNYPDGSFPVGTLILTQAGQSIASLIERTTVDDHFDSVIKYLASTGVEFSEKPQIEIVNYDFKKGEIEYKRQTANGFLTEKYQR